MINRVMLSGYGLNMSLTTMGMQQVFCTQLVFLSSA